MSCILSFNKRAMSLNSTEDYFHIYNQQEFYLIETTWNLITIDHPYLNSSNLNAIKNSTGNDINFHYIVFNNEKGENTGVAYFQLLSFDHQHYKSFFRVNSLINWFEKKLINNRFNILVCGSLFSIESSGYYFKSGLTLKTAHQFYSATRALAKRIRASSLLIKDVPDSDVEFLNSLGLNAYEGDKTMQLAIQNSWNNISDYENTLKHKYAQRFRSIKRKLQGVLIKELNETDIILNEAKLFSLFESLVEKQTIRLGRVNSNYFSELKKAYGANLKIFGFFKNNILIAFVIHRIHIETKEYEIHFVGFDEIENKNHSIYFNILFHSIEQAILNKCNCLEMGRTAIEAKYIIGAQPRKINGFFYFYNPLARWLFNILKNIFLKNTESKVIERHPFKTDF